MKKHIKCENCEIRGYSPELCRVHYRKGNLHELPHNCPHRISINEVGKTAALGAGVGLAATAISLAAIPAVALKTIFGHVVAVKVSATAGGGVTGAGINLFRRQKKGKKQSGAKTKKRIHFPTLA